SEMKKPYLLFCILFLIYWSCEDTKEEEPHYTFVKTFGSNGGDIGRSVQQTADGGYIITGKAGCGVDGGGVWLLKTNSQGIEEWSNLLTNAYGCNNGDGEGRWIQKTTDGGYVIVGTSFPDFYDEYHDYPRTILLIKTDSQGQVEWKQNFGGIDYGLFDDSEGRFVQQTDDGGFILTGYTYSTKNHTNDVWLIKTDANGNEEWNRTLGDSIYFQWNAGGDEEPMPYALYDYGSSVQQTSDGGYIIGGYSTGWCFDSDWRITCKSNVLLIKTDSRGDREWLKSFGESKAGEFHRGHSVQITPDGGYIIAGERAIGNEESNFWLIKTDSNGNQIWDKTYGNGGEKGWSVQQTTDGGYIMTGQTHSMTNYWDWWLLKTDSNGNEIWDKTFGGSEQDYGGYCVQQTTDGGFILTGQTYSFGNDQGSNLWLIKTNSEGNTEPYDE
ncbi:MAG: hypothetical protein VX680_04025, partial [Candidatus Neomarinimicrobiota bacterium]|nr:hypothetical protein [Candidatus Neomarinimicrobiota bacterium]